MIKRGLQINTLYNGDSAHLLSDIEKFPNNCVNLIVTSPPYADKRKNSYQGVPSNKYVQWFLPITDQLKRILKEDGSFILNIKEHPSNGER
jgi:site-specific DNA-methyltransferase (adenine-specific)